MSSEPSPVRERALRAAVQDLQLTGGELVGSGLEFQVWRMRHQQWGEVALRLPAQAVESNPNDPLVDTAELLRHEALVYMALGGRGIPLPRLYDLRHYEVDVLVSEYVATDGSAWSSEELGRIVAGLHEAPVPVGIAPERSEDMFRGTIAERVSRRHSVLRDLAPELEPLPGVDMLAAAVPEFGAGSLLHMDVRAANVLSTGGRVSAVIDWSNSMVGDPALELARIETNAMFPENGIDHPEFLQGYRSVRPLPERSDACRSLYRLDAAVMLSIVFTCEAPDAERGRLMLDQVRDLAKAWQQ
ncbi:MULTISPECIES: phosphotransferase [unclassified Streptomyces]|uniref:phosphotransferase family protein n=1 Tax=unclassified Streptomyces TaxID=2593676 RepID=UPI00136837CD|nr:phosphotransferase [Streptomyces sp. MnatMP-M77]MYT77474.1 phosphotransferase [Streptomyces sp. SID8364]